jgi:K+-transporting ATPase A subunit
VISGMAALFAAMAVMFTAGLVVIYASKATQNAAPSPFGIDQAAGTWQPGGNKVRFGVGNPRCSPL